MRIAVLIAFVISFGSCAPLYVPNARNTPLFDQPGEAQVSFGYASGFDLQSAYAVSEHVGVMVNYFNTVQSGTNVLSMQENNFRYRHRLIELGMGYYTNLTGNEGQRVKIYAELFGGGGWACGSGVDNASRGFMIFQSQDTVNVQSRYRRYFIQPLLAFRFPSADLTLTCRISAADFYRTEITSTPNKRLEVDQLKAFFEPSVGYRLYTRNRKLFFNFQCGFNYPLSQAIDEEYVEYVPFSGTVGVGIKLHSRNP
jgi:hypothetical protein